MVSSGTNRGAVVTRKGASGSASRSNMPLSAGTRPGSGCSGVPTSCGAALAGLPGPLTLRSAASTQSAPAPPTPAVTFATEPSASTPLPLAASTAPVPVAVRPSTVETGPRPPMASAWTAVTALSPTLGPPLAGPTASTVPAVSRSALPKLVLYGPVTPSALMLPAPDTLTTVLLTSPSLTITSASPAVIVAWPSSGWKV